jgi:GxxExxY protein
VGAELEALAKTAVDCGFQIHKGIGPGLLESAYEMLLFESIRARGLHVERQISISISANGITLENAFRADLLVERKLLIEIRP